MKISLTLLSLLIVQISIAQNHLLFGINGDTLTGRIEETAKNYVQFMTNEEVSKKIPNTAISGLFKWGYYFPMLDGVLAKFPVLPNNKAGISGIEEIEGRSADELYKGALEYINSNAREFSLQIGESTVTTTYQLLGVQKQASHNIDNQYKNVTPVKYSDSESKKIITRVVGRYEGGGFGCVRLVWFDFDLILQFKDGRYKYELSNYSYSHYNAATLLKAPFMEMQDGGDCGSSGNLENLLRCNRCHNEFDKMYLELIRVSSNLATTVKEGLVNQNVEKEDW
jgi:hypothetical protein